jgi:hypothetical protein
MAGWLILTTKLAAFCQRPYYKYGARKDGAVNGDAAVEILTFKTRNHGTIPKLGSSKLCAQRALCLGPRRAGSRTAGAPGRRADPRSRCGNGVLKARLATIGCSIVGVDASPEQIEAALKLGVDARIMDAEQLDFDAEFDAIIARASSTDRSIPAPSTPTSSRNMALRPVFARSPVDFVFIRCAQRLQPLKTARAQPTAKFGSLRALEIKRSSQ